jgi:hypothetical protein
MPKRRALLLLGLILALYPVSYLVVSRDGYYDSGPMGFAKGPGRTVILVSKFGYAWYPFHGCELGLDDFQSAPVQASFSILYLPLMELDRKWWHTEVKAESGNYPVKRGFSIGGKTGTARVSRAGK